MSTTDQELVKEFIAKKGVTLCPPALAKENSAKAYLREHVSKIRKMWKKDAKK